MNQVSLSRWTMLYFACALVALLTAQVLMAAGVGYPASEIKSPATLVLVHLVALGWLSLLLCGALFQFVPVLVARPLHSDGLPLPTLIALLGGLGLLLCGFLQLDGTVPLHLPLLPAGGLLLGAGFVLALYNLGRTLWAARPLPLPARLVAAGLASLAATFALGIVFTLVLGSVSDWPLLLALTAAGLPLHVIAGLGGWLTFTAMGVSYRLLAMFMLAPEERRPTSLAAFWGGVGVLLLAIAGGAGAVLLGFDPMPILAAAGVLALPVLGLYGYDVAYLYRSRKRRRLETNSRIAILALGSLAAAGLMMAGLLALGELPRHVGALVFLIAFGWLSGLGLAKLYKIVPFVTWLECYGPVLGKKPTPRVQDLVVEARAGKWFLVYFAGVWLATAALLLERATLFRASAALMLLATGALVIEFIRARRLSDVDMASRLPEGARRPRLLLASSSSNQTR